MMKRIFQKIIVFTLILSVVVPASLISVPPKKAEASFSACISTFFSQFTTSQTVGAAAKAIAVPVHDLAVKLDTTVNASQSQSSFMKDCIEHGIALAIGRMILSQMTDQIVTWINSGFEGKPAFITDPKGFFTDIADQVAGEFIAGSALSFLCSPFKLQIQIQLSLDYSSGRNRPIQRCTLSQIFDNVEGAITDFSQQSWDDWFKISQHESNNPYGSYLKASSDIDVKIAGAASVEVLKLNWAGGFLSWSECTTVDGYDDQDKPIERKYNQYGGSGTYSVAGNEGSFGGRRSPQDKCTIQTPGRVIANQLDTQLGIPAQQLGLADDLDKIFNALGNQLFKTLISGAGGLLGSTDSSNPSRITPRPRRNVAQLLQDACSGYYDPGNTTTSSYNPNTNLGRLTQDSQVGCLAAQNDYNADVNQANNPNQSQDTGTVQARTNIALNKTVTFTGLNAAGHFSQDLTDGNTKNVAGSYTGPMVFKQGTTLPSFTVNLDKTNTITRIVLYERNDSATDSNSYKANNVTFVIEVLNAQNAVTWSSGTLTQDYQAAHTFNLPVGISGQYIRIRAVTATRSDGGTPFMGFPELEVYPNNPPVITLKGDSPLLLNVGDPYPYTEPYATAADEVDSAASITARITASPRTINTSQTGEFIIRYNVTDSGGAPAKEVTRTVLVGQTGTAPVITLNNPDQNPYIVTFGTQYTEPGAIAVDAQGDISNRLQITNNINPTTAGTYTVRYNVTNAAGLSAQEVTRTVIIQ